MKKVPTYRSRKRTSEDMRSEYQFDYRKARPNRFAGRGKGEHLVVVLDPDIAQVFTTPESVNTVLRALIETMPQIAKQKATDMSIAPSLATILFYGCRVGLEQTGLRRRAPNTAYSPRPIGTGQGERGVSPLKLCPSYH